MEKYTIKLITTENEWENSIANHPEANFLQSWYWGEFNKKLGKKVITSLLIGDSQTKGAMLAIVEEAKRARYLVIPGGPLIDWTNSELVDACIKEIISIAKANNCSFVRIRPQVIESEETLKIIVKHGFIKSPMHLTADLTSQLDITQTEDDLLKNMRKNTRSEIKKALQSPITIETSDNPDDIQKFYEIQLDTAKRQHFVPFSYDFLHIQFENFRTKDLVKLYSAKVNNETIAMAFIIFYGQEAVYHYGASTPLAREYPAAYLLQWEAIKEAKRRGLKKYNFWGVSPEGQSDHRFYGVSIFKRGFGGKDIQYIQAHDLIINKSRYAINYCIETLRKKIRKL
ncbi:MAG: peptidoglycan bridge formation glycyltransferase FemA/FemB family protein [bacterium]|nr:peptidoglycan bridge formation glycyltransferase FemA/FemB family protein [bacterium]